MAKLRLRELLLCLILAATLVPSVGFALPISQAIEAIGDNLVGSQTGSGTWLGEQAFTGSIVAGLCQGYEVTGDSSYRNAAQQGGNYILNNYAANPFGDMAYALARLTEVTGDTSYANAALNFYNGLNTQQYINGFGAAEPSTATFYVSQHAVAASKVGATDAGLWRQGVMDYLVTVDDDTADYPVMGLGVATWALAQTGPLDLTALPAGEAYWAGVRLSDLPGLLLGHQVDSGGYAGSFYWRYDHASSGGSEASGYTEDTAFGALGLIAANESYPGLALGDEILAARQALASGVDPGGSVYEHIWSGGASYKVYGGEVLEALPEPVTLLLLGTGGLTLLLRRRRYLR